MNNLSSYCGLVDAKIRSSDKDLPVSCGVQCSGLFSSLNLRIGGGAFGKSLMLNAGGNSLRPFLPPLLVKSASAAEHAEP